MFFLTAALELGVTKLGTILEAVYSAKSKWYSLGLVLQVPVVILEEIRSQYPDDENCLREVLKFWLKRADPTPTWSALAKALGSKEVRENRLAMGLKFKYCFTEDLLGLWYKSGNVH